MLAPISSYHTVSTMLVSSKPGLGFWCYVVRTKSSSLLSLSLQKRLSCSSPVVSHYDGTNTLFLFDFDQMSDLNVFVKCLSCHDLKWKFEIAKYSFDVEASMGSEYRVCNICKEFRPLPYSPFPGFKLGLFYCFDLNLK